MTVAKLIDELKKCPQDADVYRFNESFDYYYSDTEEFVTTVEKDEYGYSVTIK